MAAQAFGELFKRLRMEKQMTLREFCVRNDYDPGNISKLERGKLPPPQSPEKLLEYARALGIEDGSSVEREFVDLGLACAGQIPTDVMEDEDLLAHLPVLLRTVSGKKLSSKKLEELIDIIREA